VWQEVKFKEIKVNRKAWQWALSFPKEERSKKFQEMKEKYQKQREVADSV